MESRPSSKSSDTTLYDQYADLEKFQRFPDPSKETLHTWISRVTLAMLAVLTLATIGGLVVSGLVFGQSVTVNGQCASQSFVLFAVSSSSVKIFDSTVLTFCAASHFSPCHTSVCTYKQLD